MHFTTELINVKNHKLQIILQIHVKMTLKILSSDKNDFCYAFRFHISITYSGSVYLCISNDKKFAKALQTFKNYLIF
jgi:hypothetical protein